MRAEFSVSGADEVALGLEALPHELNADLAKVVKDSADRLQRQWRSNARKTARRHGKRYPSSITTSLYEQEGSVYADIGPQNDKLQGRMGPGFEYGSVHQSPHYDGALAFADEEPKFTQAVAEHVGYVSE